MESPINFLDCCTIMSHLLNIRLTHQKPGNIITQDAQKRTLFVHTEASLPARLYITIEDQIVLLMLN